MIRLKRAVMIKSTALLFMVLLLCPLYLEAADTVPEPLTVNSPDGRLRVKFWLDEQGRPVFDVAYRDTSVAAGRLGLEFVGWGLLDSDLKVVSSRRKSHDQTYTIPVGKASSARDHHHELLV